MKGVEVKVGTEVGTLVSGVEEDTKKGTVVEAGGGVTISTSKEQAERLRTKRRIKNLYRICGSLAL